MYARFFPSWRQSILETASRSAGSPFILSLAARNIVLLRRRLPTISLRQSGSPKSPSVLQQTVGRGPLVQASFYDAESTNLSSSRSAANHLLIG